MKINRLSLVSIIAVISLLSCGMVYAADGDRGGGRSGGHDGGGDRYYGQGGHSGHGDHHGGSGHYGGWGHYGGYYGTGFGLTVDAAYWGWPWYYPFYAYPYYYNNPYAPAVSMPSDEPQEYIQRSDKVSAPVSSGVWYYCPESKIYYPYVKECPGGWQTVPAQPLSEQGR